MDEGNGYSSKDACRGEFITEGGVSYQECRGGYLGDVCICKGLYGSHGEAGRRKPGSGECATWCRDDVKW